MRLLIAVSILGSVCAWGQVPAQDARGCAESRIVSRMPGCVIMRCENKDFASSPMPKSVSDRASQAEGQVERIVYRCPASKSPLELGRNTEAALKNAGFAIDYTYVYGSGGRFYMTAHKAPYWVKLQVLSDNYEIITVKEKAMEQVMTANAEGWAAQVNQTGRVSLYGINFDTGKASLRPDSEPVLSEVLKLLQTNGEWAMMVAGHTDNVGAPEMNLGLSRQRAESVIAWLAGRGVDRARLVAAGFGDKRPVAPNTNEEGRQKNRRVDLVKVY